MQDETSQAVVGDSVASALEEGRGGRKRRFWQKKPKKETEPLTHCENCGEELRGRYCSNCGQAAVSYHRSFRHVVVDVLDSFLNWDSKFIRSIGLLLWRPGWLTNQFLEGKRVRFVHPLRLYLLVSIVFFLCARLIPVSDTRSIKREDMTPEQRAVFDEKMAKLKEKQKKHSIFSFTTGDKKPAQPAENAYAAIGKRDANRANVTRRSATQRQPFRTRRRHQRSRERRGGRKDRRKAKEPTSPDIRERQT